MLFSPRSHSALPGMPIQGDPGGYPAKDEIADYLEQYGSHVEDRGVSPVPGLFYVGRGWQISRASALLCGVGGDAGRMVAHVLSWLRRVRS